MVAKMDTKPVNKIILLIIIMTIIININNDELRIIKHF